MVQVLALETTTEVCSVAVNKGANIVGHSIVAPRKHNKFLLKIIDELLDGNNIRRTDLELIAFSAGPGSFTGVRLGASVAQAIAFGLGLNVVVVPTSLAMAVHVRVLQPNWHSCTLVRWSRRGWFYVSEYRWINSHFECVQNDELFPERSVPTGPNVVRDNQLTLSAHIILDIALTRTTESVAPERALPLYVAGDSPYQVLQGA